MPNEERMTLNERRKYLRLIKKRYLKASKFERGRLLDEMEGGGLWSPQCCCQPPPALTSPLPFWDQD
jgi:hypothetical protein